jgi:ABC-type nitrate/sulfonate/bicarbonate transport system substrate-binding protein
MSELVDRRLFLRRGAMGVAGAAVLGSGVLAACGSDAKSSSGGGGSKSFGTIGYQLSWIKNSEFGGSYIADQKGYYKSAGFAKVNLIAGGPNVTQDAVVQAGSAFVGISAPDITASAINKGADLVIVAAQYQKNPFCVMSLAKTPIKTPQDMIGKKIGIQATNDAVWSAFLKVNNIDESKVTKVTVQFDPTPLTTGDVDGWFSFITNEPNLLKVQGIDTYNMLLNDFGYPLVSETYMVKRDALTSGRDKLKALLLADIKGWRDSVADPALSAKYAVTIYGKDQKLDLAEQTLDSKAQNDLILTDDTKANGIFTVTDKLLSESISTLKLAGIDISQSKLFDMSVIDEVYKENPDLKKSPV